MTRTLTRLALIATSATLAAGVAPVLVGPTLLGAASAACSPTQSTRVTSQSGKPDIFSLPKVARASASISRTGTGRKAVFHATATATGSAKATGYASVTAVVDVCPGGVSHPATATKSETLSGLVEYATVSRSKSARTKAVARFKALFAAKEAAKRAAKASAPAQAMQAAIDRASAEAIAAATQKSQTSTGSSGSTSDGPTGSYSGAVTPDGINHPSLGQMEIAVTAALNNARAQAGLSTLTTMTPIATWAANWATNLINNDLPSNSLVHSSPNLSTIPELNNCTDKYGPSESISGYDTVRPTSASGSTDAEAARIASNAINIMLSDSAHRSIVMAPGATRIGTGVAVGYDPTGAMRAAVVLEVFIGQCPQVA